MIQCKRRANTLNLYNQTAARRRLNVKNSITLFLLVLTSLFAVPAMAQDAPKATDTYLIARTATGKARYNYVEAIWQKGRIILFDVGYIDFGKTSQYREVLIGGGGVLIDSKKVVLIGEAYLDQAFGPTSGHATYFVPWAILIVHPTSKVNTEITYFPYLPLNKAGSIQHVLEQAKTEYDFGRFKIGAGYAGYQFRKDAWESRPFITTTLKAGSFGNLELWLQRLPGNHLVAQVRYSTVFHHTKAP